MADAEIIPIGTRGRPGRGTGSAKPSASARSLAGSGARSKPALPKRGADAKSVEPGAPAVEPSTETTAAVESAAEKSAPAKTVAARTRNTKSTASKRTTEPAAGVRKTPKRPAAKARKHSVESDRVEETLLEPTPSGPGAVPSAKTDAPAVPPLQEVPPTPSDQEPQPTQAPAPEPEGLAGGSGFGGSSTRAAFMDALSHAAGRAGAAGMAGAAHLREAGVGRATSSTTTEERTGDGIPVSDWMHAFTTAAVELFGDDWEAKLAEFMAFLRRRASGEYAVDEYGFDAEMTERFFHAAVRPIAEKWFRVEVRGADNIPADGGALVVSNHSGTVPIDGLVTGLSIFDHTGRHLRPLGADLVFRLPIVGELARKGGATLACNDDAERMLRGGELVGVWPEGFKGIGKPYSERYKLQRFGRGGFVSAALRTGVPIIPCSVVGAEEIYPLVGNIPSLARLLGVPYIPITPFFPLLGPLGLVPLPSKWLIEFGEPIRTDTYDDGAADDPMLVFNVTDQVRETIQQTLYSLLMQRRSVFH